MAPIDTQTALVEQTNKLTPALFSARYLPKSSSSLSYTPEFNPSITYNVSLKSSSELTTPEFNACFSLIETTSSAAYKASSVQWRPKKKKEEMRERDMRYLLLRSSSNLTPSSSTSTPPPSDSQQREASQVDDDAIEGFLSFQITFDDDYILPVLYIYEIHLSPSTRNQGVGTYLMRLAGEIATRVGVAKLMLTVFVSNEGAIRFYKGLGFEKDDCSPADRVVRGRTVKADYMIMSVDVGGLEGGEMEGSRKRKREE